MVQEVQLIVKRTKSLSVSSAAIIAIVSAIDAIASSATNEQLRNSWGLCLFVLTYDFIRCYYASFLKCHSREVVARGAGGRPPIFRNRRVGRWVTRDTDTENVTHFTSFDRTVSRRRQVAAIFHVIRCWPHV